MKDGKILAGNKAEPLSCFPSTLEDKTAGPAMTPRPVLIRRTSPCTLHPKHQATDARIGRLMLYQSSYPGSFDLTLQRARSRLVDHFVLGSSARPRFLNFPKTPFPRLRFAPPPTREPTEGDDLREQHATCDMMLCLALGHGPNSNSGNQILTSRIEFTDHLRTSRRLYRGRVLAEFAWVVCV